MVYISKVYTRSGDEGKTMLANGAFVGKETLRIRAYGDVDELNTVLGMIRVELAREPRRPAHEAFCAKLDAQLARIQQELFNLGAELATPEAAEGGAKLKIEQRHVDALEHEIDEHNAHLEPLRSFILPGGGPVASAAHVGRTVCRRAEREVVALARAESVREESRKYMNRLSDYLFVVARAAAKQLGYDEALWDPKTT
jgi:cob(I)alamin adenosyltransferase